uniref:Uncharacterized protein n=1 Tax=Solanum tuberosum TaxID=4113 RepID=M1DXP2_SOLTU
MIGRWHGHFGDPPSGSSIPIWLAFFTRREDHRPGIFSEAASLLGDASMRFGEPDFNRRCSGTFDGAAYLFGGASIRFGKLHFDRYLVIFTWPVFYNFQRAAYSSAVHRVVR